MKLKELHKIVNTMMSEPNSDILGELELVIPNNRVSYGRTSTTKLKSITEGFDWDSGLLFLNPERKMKDCD